MCILPDKLSAWFVDHRALKAAVSPVAARHWACSAAAFLGASPAERRGQRCRSRRALGGGAARPLCGAPRHRRFTRRGARNVDGLVSAWGTWDRRALARRDRRGWRHAPGTGVPALRELAAPLRPATQPLPAQRHFGSSAYTGAAPICRRLCSPAAHTHPHGAVLALRGGCVLRAPRAPLRPLRNRLCRRALPLLTSRRVAFGRWRWRTPRKNRRCCWSSSRSSTCRRGCPSPRSARSRRRSS